MKEFLFYGWRILLDSLSLKPGSFFDEKFIQHSNMTEKILPRFESLIHSSSCMQEMSVIVGVPPTFHSTDNSTNDFG